MWNTSFPALSMGTRMGVRSGNKLKIAEFQILTAITVGVTAYVIRP